MTAAELPDLRGALFLGAARGQKRFAFHQLPGMRLQPGDVVVYLPAGTGCAVDPPPRAQG